MFSLSKRLKIEKTVKRQKISLSGRDEEAYESAFSGPHTEIFGNSRINIDGCFGVAEYRDTYIKLRLNKGMLILCGSGFDIVFFENRLITVKGKISSVEFCM